MHEPAADLMQQVLQEGWTSVERGDDLGILLTASTPTQKSGEIQIVYMRSLFLYYRFKIDVKLFKLIQLL